MKINLDRNIYSDSCISNVVYWLSSKYPIQRTINNNIETLIIDNVNNELSFKKVFFQTLNDYKLRDIIDSSTKDIKTILYAKAFGEFDEFSEEDIIE